jgi:FkbM family methyltransferase
MIVQQYVGNFLMSLDLEDNGISRVLYSVGEREKAFMSILSQTVKRGMVCLDLGANIGYTTLYMLDNVGKDGMVYAIEPGKHNLELLQKNVEQNNFEDICEITEGAISSEDGMLDFWLADAPNLHSFAKTHRSTDKVSVEAYTLETFLKNKKFPNFIKMDVEGHEVDIFKGGLNYFKNNPGPTNILVEVHPSLYNEENDFAEILKEYFAIGFKPKYVVTTPIPQPRLFKEAGYVPVKAVETDGFHRGIYENISEEHLLEFACKENPEGNSKKIVRSFMITRS